MYLCNFKIYFAWLSIFRSDLLSILNWNGKLVRRRNFWILLLGKPSYIFAILVNAFLSSPRTFLTKLFPKFQQFHPPRYTYVSRKICGIWARKATPSAAWRISTACGCQPAICCHWYSGWPRHPHFYFQFSFWIRNERYVPLQNYDRADALRSYPNVQRH